MAKLPQDPAPSSVVVVGGGIAGLSVAYHLARQGAGEVVLLEQERVLASHASGRNAAMYRPVHPSPGVGELARRTAECLAALGDELPGALPHGWLDRTGLLLVAGDRSALEADHAAARRTGYEVDWLRDEALLRAAPMLEGGDASVGLRIRDGGVIDIHAVTSALAQAARRAGARIVLRAQAARIRLDEGSVSGLELTDGRVLRARSCVIAGGAFAGELGKASGLPLPLIPRRRHLMHLDVAPPGTKTPVWRLEPEVYFRAEVGGALASPGDSEPWRPGIPVTDEEVIAEGARRLAKVAPAFAGAGLRRAWACLRTFAPDEVLVAGADPRARGLFWLVGLGGHGLSVGPAVGELVADLVRGVSHPLATALAPARLLD